MEKLNGDYMDQYGQLREYCEELVRSNPGSTIKIDVEPGSNPSSSTRQFRRIYVCYGALKKGFNLIGRDLIGLNGAFMKGPYPGQILSAIGVDGKNGIYPLAFAIVEAETINTWTWFFNILGDDLELPTRCNFTFISDRQKGLLPAMAKIFPIAEHRYCLRHIHENMKKIWRGDVYKNLLWRCASATSMPYYERAMEDIKAIDRKLYDWVKEILTTAWSRAHFPGRAKCDMLLNNICEVFNK
ncbi:putative MULE transposase domain-containing protein [Helianthus annuus]|nr:putative MULE transposase domain-containing protein [Helianthus annuus]KAJ0596566.1 putative MULE transposase domain-containing protein [Helianthus annuus]KAJ0757228.1 putative MULE transposase domain-containing protein [Helianthus annuus]KAJ0760950.1 putative MULE transposase domain-containing protein [Helianthus annuus]